MGIYSLKNVYNVLKDTNFYTDDKPYIFYKFNKTKYANLHHELAKYPDVYSEILNDKDELSLILPKDVWESDFSAKFSPLEKMNEIALITCEIQNPSTGGFLHSLVTMLATHSISVYVQTAFTTDHIFVNFNQLEDALQLLNQLKSE